VREETLDKVEGCGSTDRWKMQTKSLGTGTYGAVQQVKNAQGKQYAIKSVLKAANRSELENEITALRHFERCPGVVKMIDESPCDETGQRIKDAYVMELYQQDLHTYMHSNLICFGYIFVEVLRAVDCMHSHGWIHADIKPNNVFLNTPLITSATECSDPGWQVAVGDFGLSHPIGSHFDQFPGNASEFQYLHPHMFGSESVEAKQEFDWYSLIALYCDLMEQYVTRKPTMISLNEEALKKVAEAKGFTAFDDMWYENMNLGRGGKDVCFE